jgi:polysaccharide pyruvyl transferase WcaK-like protein
MRSCTVTYFSFFKNYGQFLQAFSLQEILGKKNRILNYWFEPDIFIGRLKKIPLLWRFIAFCRNKQASGFQEAQKLSLTRHYKSYRMLLRNIPKEDCWIAGSDQVWNTRSHLIKEVAFLTFAPPSARRISYAASLGMPQWPKDFEQKVLPELRKFHAISVREESSAEYLRALGLNAVCVCDPTILHIADFYRKEFYKPGMESHTSEPFTFIYRLREDLSENLIYKLNNRKIVWQDMRKRKYIPVADWLWNIDHADLVVTDSFHAVVFCLLFHTPFEVIFNAGKIQGMNERFSMLLGKVGIPLDSKPAEIDWESVDARLAEWREYSKNWLMDALGDQEEKICL